MTEKVIFYSHFTASLLQHPQNDISGTKKSMYERLREEIGIIHDIQPENVDIFSLRDFGSDVDVRYNCHGSPYYTSARLDGLMLARLKDVS